MMSFESIGESIKRLWHSTGPVVVTGTGITLLAGMPYIQSSLTEAGTTTTSSLGTLHILNLAAFAINVISVSIPGRLDGKEAEAMTKTGSFVTSDYTEVSTPPNNNDTSEINDDISYSPNNSRTLIVPSGWAFIIWAPIYIGEAIFCCYGQFIKFPNNNNNNNDDSTAALAAITGPFTIACCIQSLWCASFRPSYFTTTRSSAWKRYVSVGMLAGTAYSLFQLHSIRLQYPTLATVLIPMTLHSGWTTAATLVNFNGSLASGSSTSTGISDTIIIASGHASVVIATIIGCYVGVNKSIPIYSATIAWALTACSTGIRNKLKRLQTNKLLEEKNDDYPSDKLVRAMSVQHRLCQAGALLCLTTAVAEYFGYFNKS